jgi:pre-mRNA-splicing factor ATP-dependent RNA helicase DHX38/PRP16
MRASLDGLARVDGSLRSTPGSMYRSTPISTPSYKQAAWNKSSSGNSTGRSQAQGELDDDVRQQWRADEEQLDRRWYQNEDGHDEDFDPFVGMEEYTAKKEEQVRVKAQQTERISAHRRQLNADQNAWEQNRMLTSGAVQRVGPQDMAEEEDENRVQLLVHHVVPPFLDGRIAFSKHPEPVIPVKDPASDIAVLAKKGSLLVRWEARHLFQLACFPSPHCPLSFLLSFYLFPPPPFDCLLLTGWWWAWLLSQVRREREKQDAIKGQKKEWKLAGTQLGNIMGIKEENENPQNGGDASGGGGGARGDGGGEEGAAICVPIDTTTSILHPHPLSLSHAPSRGSSWMLCGVQMATTRPGHSTLIT